VLVLRTHPAAAVQLPSLQHCRSQLLLLLLLLGRCRLLVVRVLQLLRAEWQRGQTAGERARRVLALRHGVQHLLLLPRQRAGTSRGGTATQLVVLLLVLLLLVELRGGVGGEACRWHGKAPRLGHSTAGSCKVRRGMQLCLPLQAERFDLGQTQHLLLPVLLILQLLGRLQRLLLPLLLPHRRKEVKLGGRSATGKLLLLLLLLLCGHGLLQACQLLLLMVCVLCLPRHLQGGHKPCWLHTARHAQLLLL
jgi:hypothetical protein